MVRGGLDGDQKIMLSYARGPEAAVIESTIPEVFGATAERFADRESLVVRHQGVRMSWRELADAVERVARGLSGLGLAPGERLGVWSANCVEWVLLQLATARVGVVLVNVNP